MFKPHQLQENIESDPHRFRVVACGRRWGKAVSLDTPILTINGFRTMEDLKEGDFVFDENGKKTKVTFISEIFKDHDCYDIEFSNGDIITADANHEWLVEDKNYRKSLGRAKDITKLRKNKLKKLTTIELKENLFYGKETNFSIPVCKPIEFVTRQLPIDPYVLGAWLGDGSSGCGEFTTADQEMLDEIKLLGYENKYKDRYTYIIYTKNIHKTGKHKGTLETLRVPLKELGVINNKHIPDIYKYSDIENRLSLLQGLMDTDGTIDELGYCEYTSCNNILARDVVFLLYSFGIKATMEEYVARLYGRAVNTKFRIHFTATKEVFRLTRKKKRIKTNHKSDLGRVFIKRIYKVNTVPTKCIQVDSPNHLYLVGYSLIPTHNSLMAMHEIFQMIFAGYRATGERQRGWIVAPTFPLVRENWLIAEVLLKDVISNKKQTEMKMELSPMGFIEFKSAEREDEGLRGAGLNCLVVDEASRVSRKSWEQGLRPALSDKRGRAIFISTPRGKNWFYDFYRMGQQGNSEIISWQYPTYTNPYFPKEEWETIVKTTPELILKQEYLADFLDDEASVFHNIAYCLRGSLEEGNDNEQYTIGIDLGRAEDFTVAVVLKNSNCQLVEIYRQNKVDWSLQKAQIKALCQRYRNHLCYVDSTGIGDPIEEDLRKAGIRTRDYHFTNETKGALVEQLMVGIEQSLIGIPNCEKTKFLIEELKAFTYELLPSGKLRYTAPEGLHDDGVMALGLAAMGISHMFYHKKPIENVIPKNSPAWLEKQSFEKEIEHNMSLPRRLRQQIPDLAFS